MVVLEPCKREGDEYKCKTGLWSYTYCSVTRSDPIHLDYYGNVCTSDCDLHGEKYYWCNSLKPSGKSTWGYCSPTEGIDYQGKKCKADEIYSIGYTYCNREEGKWGYIGAIERENCPAQRVKRQNNNVCGSFNLIGGGVCDLVLEPDQGRVAGPGNRDMRRHNQDIVSTFNPGNNGIERRNAGYQHNKTFLP